MTKTRGNTSPLPLSKVNRQDQIRKEMNSFHLEGFNGKDAQDPDNKLTTSWKIQNTIDQDATGKDAGNVKTGRIVRSRTKWDITTAELQAKILLTEAVQKKLSKRPENKIEKDEAANIRKFFGEAMLAEVGQAKLVEVTEAMLLNGADIHAKAIMVLRVAVLEDTQMSTLNKVARDYATEIIVKYNSAKPSNNVSLAQSNNFKPPEKQFA